MAKGKRIIRFHLLRMYSIDYREYVLFDGAFRIIQMIYLYRQVCDMLNWN